jgi:spermidine/putrescine transport system permease protein
MILLPQLIMLDFSFRPLLPLRKIGGPEDVYTLKNYIVLFTTPLHRAIFLKTIWSSIVVTTVALTICYPIAFYLAKVARGARLGWILMGLIIPYWINELLRIFAWQLILADSGILNQLLLFIGLIAEPLNFRAGNGAVIMGMTYAYILFMVFPLYNAMESLDRNQIDAARDLGSSWLRVHRRIVIPHAKPGIAVGCIMVFMLAAGSIAAPQLLGSPSSFWFTEIIYTNFETANWNQGAAYAMVLAVLCLIFIFGMLKIFRVGLKELAS